MNAKFHIIKRVVDMESPSNNKKDEYEVSVEVGHEFEQDGDFMVFKLLSAQQNQVVLEYSRQYAVKNEIKGYEFNTTIELNQTKEITSMWGKHQTTFKITYVGLDQETLADVVDKEEDHKKYTDPKPEQREPLKPFGEENNSEPKQSTIF